MLTGCAQWGAPSGTTAPTDRAAETAAPTAADTPTPTDPADATPAQPLDACPPLSADLRAEMDAIEAQVISLRGLKSRLTVARILLTPDELRQRVIEDFFEEYDEQDARQDALVFSLLGLLPPDFDLYNFYIDLYSEQIAGFYDDELGEMAIICGRGFGGTERLTYAHEYAHALQDQAYDLDDGLGYSDEACKDDTERCAALQALVEGDATLVEEQWLGFYATQEDYTDILSFFEDFQTPVYDSAPDFIRRDLLFPYLAGRSFVQALMNRDGWSSVDAAYANPPLSTEQILHPEKYPADTPVLLEAPDLLGLLGEGWQEIERNVLGEWSAQLVLDEHLLKADAVEAVEGWGGDYYLVYANEASGEKLLLLVIQWDTMRDAHEFYAAFQSYADIRFGTRVQTSTYSTNWLSAGGAVLLERVSNQTLTIIADSPARVDAVRAFVSLPANAK
jgi:hypothetical protein